ncbi:MAG: hypothetical protein IPG54_13955 [Sphingomonadales bacterium]|nr:hypothetical protein [Sphingomonadales bacterium]
MERYDVDGVFFNASNPYGTTDYGGVNRGNCACQNCQRRFREMYGKDLPAVENFLDPNWAEYLEFQERTSDELTQRIYAKIRPHAAIMGRGNVHCDVLRNEVQRRVDRDPPEWPYQAGEHLREYAAIAPESQRARLPLRIWTIHGGKRWRVGPRTCYGLRSPWQTVGRLIST